MRPQKQQARAADWMDEPDQWRAFAFYSASMQHVLPALPLKRHPAYFETTRHLQKLNTLRNSYRQLDNLLTTEWTAGITRPAIVATFHTGPYHLVCGWLMRRRIPFSLVLSGDTLRAKAATYHRLYREVTGGVAPLNNFGLIDASDPRCLLRMRNAMRGGHLLVLYVDGNTGAGNRPDPQLKLDFLGSTLQVKTGAAYLSYLMRCPVYPVLCHWEGTHAHWKTAVPVSPRPSEARQSYVERCMADVYGLLAETLLQYAPQWEGWFYVHHDLQVARYPESERVPDAGRLMHQFIPFAFGNATFLLQRSNLQAHPVPADVYAAAWRNAKQFFKN